MCGPIRFFLWNHQRPNGYKISPQYNLAGSNFSTYGNSNSQIKNSEVLEGSRFYRTYLKMYNFNDLNDFLATTDPLHYRDYGIYVTLLLVSQGALDIIPQYINRELHGHFVLQNRHRIPLLKKIPRSTSKPPHLSTRKALRHCYAL